MKEGWKNNLLGDICEIARGGSPRPIKSFITTDEDGINWIKIGDTDLGGKYIYKTAEKIKKEGIRSSRYVQSGDFLLSNSMSFGRPYILKTDGCIHDGWLVIKKYENEFKQDFLYYLLISPKITKQFEESARGSTVRNLNTDIVSKVSVCYPPLSEQHQIVDFLDAEFAKIDELKNQAEQSLQNAKDLFQAALKEMLTPKEGWVKKKFSDIYDVRDGTHDSPKYIDSGYPLVTSKNLKGDYIDMVNVKYISEADYLAINERSRVDVGDILFAMIGTIGNATLVENEPNYAIKNMALFKVPSTQSSKFLKYILDSQSVLDEMHTKSKGTTQSFVSLGYLRNFEISIPAKEEQEQIVSQITEFKKKVDILQSNYTRTIQLCADLKQALLRQVFE